MKVTIVALKYNQDGGGSNRSLELLVENLSDDFEIKLVTLRDDLTHYTNFEVPIREYSSSSSADVFKNCLTVLRNNESNTDLYHIFTPDLIPIGGIYRRFGGDVPVIGRLNTYGLFCTNYGHMDGKCHQNCHIVNKVRHDDSSNRYKRLPRYFYKSLSPAASKYVDCLIAISPAVKRIYQAAGFDNRIEVIPNCYDPKIEASTNIQDKTLLFVGRLTEEKGVHFLIKAFDCIYDDIDHTLRIVGNGPEKHRLKQLVLESSLSDRVTFTGWVPHEDLSNEFRTASLFIHPGTWPEPFGRTILEAMQYRIPLVVTDIGGPPWVADDSAVTVKPRDVNELAQGIQMALKPSIGDRLLKNAQDNLQRFAPEKTTAQLKRLYMDVSKN